MSSKLKEVIKNAKYSSLKIDGYYKFITIDEDGEYGFGRLKPMEWENKTIVGIVKTFWEKGIFKVKYESV